MKKKVSIIIPVYNGSNYLKEAIDSALAQTYDNIEIIVVNDGSTDNGATKAIAESYGDKICYYEKENGGAATALNYGISKMTGDYFSWLSHDDLYYPNKIERQMEEIKKYDDNTILFSNFDFINAKGEKLDTVRYDHEELEEKPDYAVLRGYIGGITLLIPKHILDECGEFNKEYRCVQDYDMWFRMLGKYKFVHMEDVLSMTRIHSMQDTQTSPNMIKEGNWLWAYMAENYPKEKKIEYEGSEYLFYIELENFLESGPYKEAIEKIHNMAEELYKKEIKKGNLETTIIIVDDKSKEDLETTIKSIENQTVKGCTIIIEGNTKIKGYKNTKDRNESIKEVKTDYFSILHAGIEAKENWIEMQTSLANLVKKGVIISDYVRPIRSGRCDNLCSFLLPIDGVILKKTSGIKYENDYQYMYDIAKKEGSMVTKDNYLINRVESYNIEDAFNYLQRVIADKLSKPYQIASLSYDISCVYNHYAESGKKVYMYEPCAEYSELKFSRSFQLFKKYYDYKKKKKKKL